VAELPRHPQNGFAFRSLRVVPDANTYTRGDWVERLILEAEAERIRLYWSPKVVEEASRMRLWIWIKKSFRATQPPQRSSGWKALWAQYSEEAHRWFGRVSRVTQAIEDHEPHEPGWASPHPDPNDIWLWNTARRVGADVVTTMNLKDGPPVDLTGVRQHERIVFMHPDTFMRLLTAWNRLRAAGSVHSDLRAFVLDLVGADADRDVQIVLAHLQAILAKIAAENEDEQR